MDKIRTDFIKLDSYLKFIKIVTTGGEAKQKIKNGEVKVNGKIEFHRGRKLVVGDEIVVDERTFIVQ